VRLHRDTVEKEVIYVELGVNEEGDSEILDFFVGGQGKMLLYPNSRKKNYKITTILVKMQKIYDFRP
jgi:putative transposase